MLILSVYLILARMVLVGLNLDPLSSGPSSTPQLDQNEAAPMQLGAFSISLAVKDIKASKAFYEKLGFKSFGGDVAQNWAILKNGDHIIGLFQGMFEKNM